MAETPDTATPGAIRVVRLFSRLNIGGPAIHVILLTAGLEQRGYRTRLVVGKETPREGNMLSLAAAKGVRCEAMAGLGREIQPVADLQAFLGLVRLIREFRPSIVHTHTAKAGLLGRLAARFAGVPVVVHTFHGHVLRGYFGPVKTAVFRRLETILGGMADALVAVSEAVKQDLVTLGVADRERIRVVPLGLDLEPFTGPLPRGALRTGWNVPADAPLVGIVGRLVPIKDVPTFLEAAVRVVRSHPGCRFAIVGDGEERSRLEERTLRLGLADVVAFHGWHADMSAVYGDLDVVVNCSHNEGTPVALIEALAAGRPVVATRVGGTPDLLGEDERGLLVAPGDPDALARAILETLRDPDAARTRARAGRRYVLESHSSARLVGDIDALYRELLAAKEVAA
jgi:glycosyltransferase involved in cell wall biosynthesis